MQPQQGALLVAAGCSRVAVQRLQDMQGPYFNNAAVKDVKDTSSGRSTPYLTRE
jgi:hypothetical protein